MIDKADVSLFVASQYSPVSFLIASILTAIFAFLTILSFIRLSNAPFNESIVGILVCILCVLGSMFMFIIWWFKRRSDEMCHSKSSMRIKVVHVLENSYFTLLVLSLSIRVILQILVGQCLDMTLLMGSAQFCNPFHDVKLIQPAHLISLMLFPLIAYVLIRETRPFCVGIAWFISVATLVWCTVYLKSVYLLPPTLIYFFISLLIFYDTKRQNDAMLQLVRALQVIVVENERLQDEVRATELRAMIGNVAHDLKTVSYYLLNSCVSTMLLLCVWSLD